ncbi:MAG: signal peptidase I [Nitrospirota bacterium]
MKLVLLLMLVIHLLPRNARAEFRGYTVAGDSMSPALVSGDKVVVDTDLKGPVQRGDLVAIGFSTSSTPMVKRVAAVPGDRIEFRDNAVWVNGRKVREIDRQRWQSTIKQIEFHGHRIPEQHYLILGDNPRNSRDSGRLGLISADRLKGRVVKVRKAEGAQ